MNNQLLLTTLCVIALLTGSAFGQSVSTLTYSSAPAYRNDHACVPCCFADACQSITFQATGVDPGPRSQWYLQLKAAEQYPDDVSLRHGWSSPILGWQLCHDFGTCNESLCGPTARRTTSTMDADAATVRVGSEFVTWYQIPTYSAALDWMAAMPASAVVITSSGRRGYAIVGIESGRGVWLDHWQRTGPPRVFLPTETEGSGLWDGMVTGPDFVVGLTR